MLLNHWQMDAIEHTLMAVVARLNMATPNPLLWNGKAASTCAETLNNLANDINLLRIRLGSWAM